jgi:hypothetical protein
MEFRYRRTRHWLRGLGVGILTPSRGEFIAGDIPALTVRKGVPSVGVNSGIGYAGPGPPTLRRRRVMPTARGRRRTSGPGIPAE